MEQFDVGAVNFGSIAGWVTLLTGFIGGIWAIVQWRRDAQIRRADFVERLIASIRATDVMEFFTNRIEREGADYYKGDFDFDAGCENIADKLLFILSYACYLKRRNLISDTDFAFFAYMLDRTLRHQCTIAYLTDYYADENLSKVVRPYDDLIHVGRDMGVEALCDIKI